MEVVGYLSVTWGMLSVSVNYMRQDDGYLSVTLGGLAVISQLHGEGWLFSVRYIRQFFGYLSVT